MVYIDLCSGSSTLFDALLGLSSQQFNGYVHHSSISLTAWWIINLAEVPERRPLQGVSGEQPIRDGSAEVPTAVLF
jgi:hypothetical protein